MTERLKKGKRILALLLAVTVLASTALPAFGDVSGEDNTSEEVVLSEAGDANPAANSVDDPAQNSDTDPEEPAELAASTNTLPHLSDDAQSSLQLQVLEGTSADIDLTEIFTDDEGDSLTYFVSIEGGDPVEAEASFSYIPAVDTTLVFTAADGEGTGTDSCTVQLSVIPKEGGVYPVRFDITYAGLPLENAVITLKDANRELVPNTENNYTFVLKEGKYSYAVSRDGFEPVYTTNFTVKASAETMVIAVPMVPERAVKYPVTLTLTDEKGRPADGSKVVLTSLDYTDWQITYKSDDNGICSFSVPRGRYVAEISKEEITRTYYAVQIDPRTGQEKEVLTYDTRDVYTPVESEIVIEKREETQNFSFMLQSILYPVSGGDLLNNVYWAGAGYGYGFSVTPAWEDLEKQPYTGPIHQCFELFDAEYAGAVRYQNRNYSVLRYTNLSGEEVTEEGEFPRSKAALELRNFLSLTKGGANHLSETVIANGEEFQYESDVILRRSLRELKAEADGERISIIPAFAYNVTEYNVTVPKGTKALHITAVPFRSEDFGYEVRIDGEIIDSSKGLEMDCPEAGTAMEIVVSHRADTAGTIDTSTTYVLRFLEGEENYAVTALLPENAGELVSGARITVRDASGEEFMPAEGEEYSYHLPQGNYTYTASSEGYQESSGSFTVGITPQTVHIPLVSEDFQEEMLLKTLTLGYLKSADEIEAWDRIEITPGVFEYWTTVDYGVMYTYAKAEFAESADGVITFFTGEGMTEDDFYDKTVYGWHTEELYAQRWTDFFIMNGSHTDRTVTVTVKRGEETQEYTVHILRKPALRNLRVYMDDIQQMVEPEVSLFTKDYRVTVPAGTEKLYVSADAGEYAPESGYRLAVDGIAVAEGTDGRYVRLHTDEDGTQVIPIALYGKDNGQVSTYTLTVRTEDKPNTPMLSDIRLRFGTYVHEAEEYEFGFRPDQYVYEIPVSARSNLWWKAELAEAYRDGSYGPVQDNSYRLYADSPFVSHWFEGSDLLIIHAESADGTVSQNYYLYFQDSARIGLSFFDADTGARLLWTRTNDLHKTYRILLPEGVTRVAPHVDYELGRSDTTILMLDGMPYTDELLTIDPDKDEIHTLTAYDINGERQATTNTLYFYHGTEVTFILTDSGGRPLPESAALDGNVQMIESDGSLGEILPAQTYENQRWVYLLPEGECDYSFRAADRETGRFWKPDTGSVRVVRGETQTIILRCEEVTPGPHTVTFDVSKAGKPVSGVKLTLDGETYDLFDGRFSLPLENHEGYAYRLEAPGCKTLSGTFDVMGEAVTLSIEMESSIGELAGETVTVYVSILSGDSYLTDGQGEIVNRPLQVSYTDLADLYMTDYYDSFEFDQGWTRKEDGKPSGKVTVLMALMEAEKQLYGTSSLTMTDTGEVSGLFGRQDVFAYLHNYRVGRESFAAGYEEPCAWLDRMADGDSLILLFRGADKPYYQLYGIGREESGYNQQTGVRNGFIPVTAQTTAIPNYSALTVRALQPLNCNRLGVCHLEMKKAGDSEWEMVPGTTEQSDAAMTIFFEEPGTYYLRIADNSMDYSESPRQTQQYHLYAVVKVEEAPHNAVPVVFSSTIEGAAVSAGLRYEVTDAQGKTRTSARGRFSLDPGLYTWTITCTKDGETYEKTGKLTVNSFDTLINIPVELANPLLLQELQFSETGEAGTWNVIDFTGKPGRYSYSGLVQTQAESKNLYFRGIFADGVSGTINIRYDRPGFGETQQSFTGSVNSYVLGSVFFRRAGGGISSDLEITVRAGERSETYYVHLYMLPKLSNIGIDTGEGYIALDASADDGILSASVPENQESINLYLVRQAVSSQEVITVTGIQPQKLDGGVFCYDVPLSKEGDTVIPIEVQEEDQQFTYTLTVRREEQNTGEAVLEDVNFYSETGAEYRCELYPLFDPDCYEYTLVVPDTCQHLYMDALVSEALRESASVCVSYRALNGTDSVLSKGIASIAPEDLTGQEKTRLNHICDPASSEKQYFSIIATDENGCSRTYTFRVEQDPDFSRIFLYGSYVKEHSIDNYYSYGVTSYLFKRGVYETETTVSAALETVWVAAQAKEDPRYRYTVNGEPYQVGSLAAIDLTGTKTPIEVQLVYQNGDGPVITKTYTITVIRPVTYEAVFHVTPQDAAYNILIQDDTGLVVYPEESGNGRFVLDRLTNYTYVVTGPGYIAQTGEFSSAEDLEFDIELTEAADNPAINSQTEASWGSFRGNDDNNGVTDAPVPFAEEDAELYWSTPLAIPGQANGAPGSPIIVGNDIYSYAGEYLLRMDRETGEILARGRMQGSSSFAITPPAYAEGMIFVAMGGGKVQAFNAETLESLWLYTDSYGVELGANQPNSPITCYEQKLYVGFWNSEEGAAHMVCLTITDEDPDNPLEEKLPMWVRKQAGGFYWAGSLAKNDAIVVGTDDGQKGSGNQTGSLLSLDPASGALLDAQKYLNGDIRSTVMYDSGTDALYFTSEGGSFYSVKLAEDGKFVPGSLRELDLGGRSTSTPVIYNGRAYVGVQGEGMFTAYDGHHIAVIDLESWEIAYTTNTKGFPQTSGLLTTAYEDTVYVYFVDNYTPGVLRVIKDAPGQTSVADAVTESYVSEGQVIEVENCAPVLYEPKGNLAQYAVASPIVDEDGTVYLKNDSNQMYAVGSRVDHLEITRMPEKTEYVRGETFDPEGMQVSLYLVNGVVKDVTHSSRLTWQEKELNPMDIAVQLTYTMKEAVYTVLVEITVKETPERQAMLDAADAIRAIGTVTLEKAEAIENARLLYDAVLPEYQEEIRAYAEILKEAEKRLAELRLDKAAAEAVEQMIAALPAVSDPAAAELTAAAKAAYDALTEVQKAMVSEESLASLENQMAALAGQIADDEIGRQQELEKQARIQEAVSLINAIGPVTNTSAPLIRAARMAYDALEDDLKAQVTNLVVLTQAEADYLALVRAASGNRPRQQGGGVGAGGTIGYEGYENYDGYGTVPGGITGENPETDAAGTDASETGNPEESAAEEETSASAGETAETAENDNSLPERQGSPAAVGVLAGTETKGTNPMLPAIICGIGAAVVLVLLFGRKRQEEEEE